MAWILIPSMPGYSTFVCGQCFEVEATTHTHSSLIGKGELWVVLWSCLQARVEAGRELKRGPATQYRIPEVDIAL